MNEVQERVSICRYAEKQIETDEKQKPQTIWHFDIARVYSGQMVWNNDSGETVMDTLRPIYFAGADKDTEMKIAESVRDKRALQWNVAVKELIIEWEDYQTEVSGYIYCSACEDHIEQSIWLRHAIKKGDNDVKQLLRFVKSPGVKTTNIKVNQENLDFFPLDINQMEVEEVLMSKKKKFDTFTDIVRIHKLECELRHLFDADQILPIKYAHLTAEIYLQ